MPSCKDSDFSKEKLQTCGQTAPRNPEGQEGEVARKKGGSSIQIGADLQGSVGGSAPKSEQIHSEHGINERLRSLSLV
jgi:hypothetical protein